MSALENQRKLRVAFVAPCSVVPAYEFELGLERLRAVGVDVKVHPQCRKRHLFFAGSDSERARAFFEMAMDPEIDVLWCARGGYGSSRMLPELECLAGGDTRRPPRKIFAGYSDATYLFEFLRQKWGWPVLHAPMPGLRSFLDIKPKEFSALLAWLSGERPSGPAFGSKKLRFYGEGPAAAIEAPVVGGNLSVWTTLLGTRYQADTRGRILFLEDVGETLSRLDRMIRHLVNSGTLHVVSAIFLGDFKDCSDPVTQVVSAPKKGSRTKPKLGPSRPSVSLNRYLRELFEDLSSSMKIPVAYGLPVGHGPGKFSLPMGGRYRLSPDGDFQLLEWDGLKS